ncbi:hypothetical protein [Alteromonas sp. S167]|uniref:hypothetical protein n=1 Tax=Alteromonas sp. S167 TaxID=3117402 RepID=UPI002FE0CCEF
MKLRYVLGSLVAGALLSTSLQAAPSASDETVNVQVVDYSGKPPFKRRVVELSVNDVAQLETAGQEAVEYVEVREVVMRGKPPYRRVTKMMPVYDVAQLEVIDDTSSTSKKGTRPPFKRHH